MPVGLMREGFSKGAFEKASANRVEHEEQFDKEEIEKTSQAGRFHHQSAKLGVGVVDGDTLTRLSGSQAG